jgi:hypothetical protein
MSSRRAIRTLTAIVPAVALAVSACGSSNTERNASVASRAASAASPVADAGGPTPPHGDHNPHHGGVVLMNGELHYEVVLDPDGRSHRLYFSDAVREDLPASFASSVALTIRRPGAPDELIPLQIDSSGESWTGSGRAVADPEKATVRVAFTIKGEPYWIEVPFHTAKP